MNMVTQKVENKATRLTEKRANELSGRDWTKLSVSVWDNIRKSPEELKLKHPAMFPVELVRRLIRCFMPPRGKVVLDPFVGSGSTLVAARELGKESIGLEINTDYCRLARRRLNTLDSQWGSCHLLLNANALELAKHVARDSVDLCITSPPYWDILSRPRTADGKETRDYGNGDGDLSHCGDYEEFLSTLNKVFSQVKAVLKPGCYFVLNVMDLRKKDRFYCFHADIVSRMVRSHWILDDIVIWNRAHEYNNLRPLGYPSVFRINKVHEYLLVMKKPK